MVHRAYVNFYNAVWKCLREKHGGDETKVDFSDAVPLKAYFRLYGIVLEFPSREKFLLMTSDNLPARINSKNIVAEALHDGLEMESYENYRAYARLLTCSAAPQFKKYKELDSGARDDSVICTVRRRQADIMLNSFAVFEKLTPELEQHLEKVAADVSGVMKDDDDDAAYWE